MESEKVNDSERVAVVSTALLCPFCGGRPEVNDVEIEKSGDLANGTNINVPWSVKSQWHTIQCSKCDCILDNGYKSPEAAIKDWNQRIVPDFVEELRAKLEESLARKDEADIILMEVEDQLHGSVGDLVTKARGILQA